MDTILGIIVVAAVGYGLYRLVVATRAKEAQDAKQVLDAFLGQLRNDAEHPGQRRGAAPDDLVIEPSDANPGARAAVEGPLSLTRSPTAAVTYAAPEAQVGDGFTIIPFADLPRFDEVGGMADLKGELRDTIGLILRHADEADRYGITWNGLLLHGPPGVGKSFLAKAMAGQFRLNLIHVSTGDLVRGIAGESAQNVKRVFELAARNRPIVLFFDEFDSIAQRRDGGSHAEERRTVNQLLQSLEDHRVHHDLVVVAATNDLEHLDPAAIRPGRFDRHIRIDLPDREARQAIFAAALRNRPQHAELDLQGLSARTQGLTAAAIANVVEAGALQAFREAAGTGEVVRITPAHLASALASRGGTDRPTVEEWSWDQLILAGDLKAELQQLEAMIEQPELSASLGVDPPTGVLLAGPPGTGKTTIARVLAAQAACSFYPVSAADVTSKWAGESERSIQRLFQRARDNRPSIIFLDEIDALGGVRGDNGTADRQLDQLLQEMDGLRGNDRVLVIGATNRPDRLDPALVRGGRLSRTITIGLPDTAARVALLALLTARMPTVGVDLSELAAATEGMSGADLKAACQQAALEALVRLRGEWSGVGELPVPSEIIREDFDAALDKLRQR